MFGHLSQVGQAVFFELSTEAVRDLRRSILKLDPASRAEIKVVQANSYEELVRNPPHCHERQLFFLDPPYDSASSYFTWNIFMMRRLRKEWPQATIALWFPCYSPEQTSVLLHRVKQVNLGKASRCAEKHRLSFCALLCVSLVFLFTLFMLLAAVARWKKS